MADAPTVPTRRFARRSRAGVFFGLSWAGMVCVGIAAGLVFLVVTRNAPGQTTGVAVLVAAGAVPVSGRALVSWIPIFGGYLWRTAVRQTRYLARVDQPRPVGNLSLPGDAARLRVVIAPDSETALVHDPHLRRLTAVLRVTHKGAVLADATDKVEMDRGWSAALGGLARFDSSICRVQTIERTLPGGSSLADHFTHVASPQVPSTSRVRAAYETLLAGKTGQLEHESLISITLDMAKAAVQIREMGGGLAGGSKLLGESMHTLAGSLPQAGLSPDRWLGQAELGLLVRSVYDPEQVPRLQAATVGRQLHRAGPMGVVEHFTHVETDSAFHRVYQVTEWPRRPVEPMALWPLIVTSGVSRSISQIYRPVPLRGSRRSAESAVVEARRQLHRNHKRRGFTDPQDDVEVQDANRRLEALTLGGREYDFLGLVTVTAPTLKTLTESCRKVQEAASAAEVEVRVLAGQQAQHLVTGALPFTRGFE